MVLKSHDWSDYCCGFVDSLHYSLGVKKLLSGLGWAAQLVRVSSWHAKVVGSIPGQGTYKNQPVSAWIIGTRNWCFSLSLSLSLSLSTVPRATPPKSISLKSIFKKVFLSVPSLQLGMDIGDFPTPWAPLSQVKAQENQVPGLPHCGVQRDALGSVQRLTWKEQLTGGDCMLTGSSSGM